MNMDMLNEDTLYFCLLSFSSYVVITQSDIPVVTYSHYSTLTAWKDIEAREAYLGRVGNDLGPWVSLGILLPFLKYPIFV